MIATLVPFFARVPITRHHTGNATHSSQDIYPGHYIRQRGGPSLLLPSSAADFRGYNSLPVPAPGRRRRRRHLPPPTPSRRATGCKSNQPRNLFLQNHSHRSPFRARAPSSRARSPSQYHKVPFSPPGSCT